MIHTTTERSRSASLRLNPVDWRFQEDSRRTASKWTRDSIFPDETVPRDVIRVCYFSYECNFRVLPAILLARWRFAGKERVNKSLASEKWRKKSATPEERRKHLGLRLRSDVPDAGRRSDPRCVVGALSCFPPKIAITKRVRALCVHAARSVWLSRGRIFVRVAGICWRKEGAVAIHGVYRKKWRVTRFRKYYIVNGVFDKTHVVCLLRSGGVRGRSGGRASERANERQTNERIAGRGRKEQRISAREKVRAITKRYREQRDSLSLRSRYDGCREREIRSAGLSVLRTDEICQCLVVTIGFCSRKSSSQLNSRKLNCVGESFHQILFTYTYIYIYARIMMYMYRLYIDVYIHTRIPIYIYSIRVWCGAVMHVIWSALVLIVGTRTRAGGPRFIGSLKRVSWPESLIDSTCLRERKRSCRRGIVGRRHLCRHRTARRERATAVEAGRPAGRRPISAGGWPMCACELSWREPREPPPRGSPKVRFPLEMQGRVAPRRTATLANLPRFSRRLLRVHAQQAWRAHACSLVAAWTPLFSRACDISSITARSRVRASAFHSYVM